jgi:hypothetical protein
LLGCRIDDRAVSSQVIPDTRSPIDFSRDRRLARAVGFGFGEGSQLRGDSAPTVIEAFPRILLPVRGARDGDGDGKSDGLFLETQEVPGTSSLCVDGAVGVEFVDVGFTGDTVTLLLAPGNDFSDI